MSSVEMIKKLYDQDADVLYVSIGDPRPAITKPLSDCDSILIRYDMKDRHICGVTIVDFSRFDKHYLLQHIPIRGLTL